MIYQINSIRAIACLAVVLVHVTALYYTKNGFSEVVIEYLNQISRFGTPIFCIITGYLFSNYFFGDFEIKKFFKSRIKKILIPYLCWSLIYLLIVFLFSKTINIENIFYKIIFGDSFYHLYFMSTILQFCILFPILRKFKSDSPRSLVFIFLINIFFLFFLKGSDLQILSKPSFLGFWIFYFYFGLYFNKIFPTIKSTNKINILFYFILISLIIGFEIYLTESIFDSRRILNLLICPTIFFILFWIFTFKRNELLNSIGRLSMGIYLIHPLVIILVYKLIDLGSIIQNPLKYLPLVFSLTLLLSILLILILTKIPYSKYLITIPKN